jgi:glycosyltransferase involved in cell wall biosynthesis
MIMKTRIKILYLIREDFPTFRPDIRILFGKYLPRCGVYASILAVKSGETSYAWEGEEVILTDRWNTSLLAKLTARLKLLVQLNRRVCRYDAVQVRDQAFIGLAALFIAKLRQKKFYYWMSWPFAEDDMFKYQYMRETLNLFSRVAYWMRGRLQAYLLSRVVLKLSDHVFVQSDEMMRWIVAKTRCASEHFTAVPMGVDPECVESITNVHEMRVKSDNKFHIGYLGVISPLRMDDVFFNAIRAVLQEDSRITMLFVGGGSTPSDQEWICGKMREIGLAGRFEITGWLPHNSALRRIAEAHVAINILPRNLIIDVSSPTKIIEYAAVGVPCVATDVPDQKKVIEDMECGICVPHDARMIAEAIIRLMKDDNLRSKYAANGRSRVGNYRGYHVLARQLSEKYVELSCGRPERKRSCDRLIGK